MNDGLKTFKIRIDSNGNIHKSKRINVSFNIMHIIKNRVRALLWIDKIGAVSDNTTL